MDSQTFRDSLLMMAVTLTLCISSLVLLHQMRILHLPGFDRFERDRPSEIGRVLAKEHSFNHRPFDGLTWTPLISGDAIYQDDTLMTGSKASAKISLEGEGEILLEENTLISFKSGSSKMLGSPPTIHLELSQGKVKVKNGVNKIRLQFKKKELKLTQNSEVVVAAEPLAERSQMKVTQGKVEVIELTENKETKSETFSGGETVSVEANKTIERMPSSFEVSMRFPESQKRFVSSQDTESVSFHWQGDTADALEWADNPGFRDVHKLKVSLQSAMQAFPPGKYYWRLNRGLLSSPPFEFTVLPNPHYRLKVPGRKGILKSDETIFLEWSSIEGAKGYILQVSRESDFRNPIFDKSLIEPRERLGILPHGAYHWRVKGLHSSLGEWPFSGSETFKVKKRLATPKSKGSKLLKRKQSRIGKKKPLIGQLRPSIFPREALLMSFFFAEAWAEELKNQITLQLEWEQIEGAKEYLIEISETEDFRNPLFSQAFKEASAIIELPRRSKLYWRIAASDEDGDRSEFSEPERIDIPPDQTEVVVQPAKEEPQPPPKEEPEETLPPKEEKRILANAPVPPSIVKLDGSESISFGMGLGYLAGNVRAVGLQIDSRGFPGGRFEASGKFGSHDMEVEITGFSQQLKYNSKDSLPEDIQPGSLSFTHFGISARLRASSIELRGVPILVGFGLSRDPYFYREAVEEVKLTGIWRPYFLMGPIWRIGQIWYLENQILLQLSLMGQTRGIGSDLSATVGARRFLINFLTPELSFGIHPYYFLLPESRTDYGTRLSIRASIKAEVELY